MENIISGAIKFMQQDFQEHKKLFESLKNKQNPHTLFIGCSDSRVIPNLITNTGPGELFVVRNIANIIPPYRVGEDYLATTSAIEYAMNFLNVKNIIVCGHSNCGGCNMLYYSEEKFENIPNVKKWLTLLENVKKNVTFFAKEDLAMRTWLTEKLNLVNSFDNILTYPGIKENFEKGELKVNAWYYIIETGEIYEYDYKTKTFALIQKKENE
ncbi:carbonic anhydrase [Campylobacter sp. MIT 21-1685]|uniref:carbonic anhydrase n=1 Tax=unclassified Campylobacter TaxID=2593542 RepID=UPI00224B1A03|nr:MULTISPECIES: carbonic anhydrase [unclassified Campylobacter]MCX2683423.1 carbonic anhydrase [Campylobacter sp. MIT 21-1684]MCX2751650.1 carbonic anhydrase [Campylobacter sp. MIT 21-1682]MCX2807851.1 carbonic anhydrase [Campylobacter sp. MIT 21-1685]